MGIIVRVFTKWLGRPGFNPRSSHTKVSKKCYLMPSYSKHRIISYRGKDNMEQSRGRNNPSSTPQCSSY